MGHSSKKKKRGGGSGRRSKGRTQSKDHASQFGADDYDQLSEEITAVCAIFQEDCKVLPGSPPRIVIKLRPYSKDMGYEDLDVSAALVVRCLPGYPFKCPKLQITQEKGLSEADTDKLLSLLHDQATLNAREGRVMIYNLVEAAQEFLSGIEPIGISNDSKLLHSTVESNEEMFTKDKTSLSKKGSFVYGFIDLFSGYGETWSWGFGMDETARKSSSLPLSNLDGSKQRFEAHEKKFNSKEMPLVMQEHPAELGTVEEVIEDSKSSLSLTSSSTSSEEDFVGNDNEGEKEYFIVDKYTTEDNDGINESESPKALPSDFLPHHQPSQTIEKDILMVHMLRLVCASNGSLADCLPQVVTELYNIGIISDSARDMASKSPSIFNKTFDRVFHKHLASSRISQFWNPDLGGSNTISHTSRYLNDFEELRPLGHGGFGHVVLCKNKLDGRQYAVKRIRLKDKSMPDRILREVATLSRLQHQHVVRYYQAWFETGVSDSSGDSGWGSKTTLSSTFSFTAATSNDVFGHEKQLESTYLYIQMEYCPRTLRQKFESYDHFDKELAWHFFRQIVEGLAHIHAQGIIHRDLTPNNIFFDARNDIKIGDFGLAKFLKLEQLDQDVGHTADATGVSIDGTGQVGTYFYTAPEIEQGWPKIDEKADMYSLGVVFFELWHPFGTAMERHVVLSDLKQKGEVPPIWIAEFPEQESLLRQLMSPAPSDRPSATELLQNAFPQRMESELLDDILRTMQKSEDTSIYDKILNAIFDEEMLSTKHVRQVGRLGSVGDSSSSIQYTEFETEVRDYVVDMSREIFRQHCAKHLEISTMRLLEDCPQFNRNAVKLLTYGGDMLELCHELRFPFVNWIISNQKSSFKRYEISYVFRRAVGHSSPNRYLQGDFDIIGGTSALTEAEVIKVTRDVVTCFFHADSCDIHLNHADLLDAIWSWTGVKVEHRLKVAELLSMMGSLRPQSSERKSKWVVIRRQLLQELNLAEAKVNRLQTVGLRFCGSADHALPRLRGALPSDKRTFKVLDELSELVSLLRIWKIEKNIYIDALMPPTESYHRDLFFQVYLRKENSPGSLSEGALLAVGGRYDYLLHQLWRSDSKGNPPTGVGTSIALETIIQNCPVDIKPNRNEGTTNILVCSRGGGGLLVERMELVAELWEENFKAEFVPTPDPSLTEQYEYANEHGIKCLVIIADTDFSLTDSVKVRHLEHKREKSVERKNLVKFLSDAMATQFRNPSIWI
ncbi:eIF-2-alpha kinase [Vigna angularis]|uniref:non-specific serine/threonine protein kinase n=1 Tax=Phaseolus angularis TaxID=3914 RepID=A0A8T0KF31_PHAAN|nr:eIF-2-alpha kinase GCN2 isoform X2 [Vigna angularis]KAG2397819.1 eIF-2-alpha kinase [Vigna angularis]